MFGAQCGIRGVRRKQARAQLGDDGVVSEVETVYKFGAHHLLFPIPSSSFLLLLPSSRSRLLVLVIPCTSAKSSWRLWRRPEEDGDAWRQRETQGGWERTPLC